MYSNVIVGFCMQKLPRYDCTSYDIPSKYIPKNVGNCCFFGVLLAANVLFEKGF